MSDTGNRTLCCKIAKFILLLEGVEGEANSLVDEDEEGSNEASETSM